MELVISQPGFKPAELIPMNRVVNHYSKNIKRIITLKDVIVRKGLWDIRLRDKWVPVWIWVYLHVIDSGSSGLA